MNFQTHNQKLLLFIYVLEIHNLIKLKHFQKVSLQHLDVNGFLRNRKGNLHKPLSPIPLLR
jgi:hypothetical protein